MQKIIYAFKKLFGQNTYRLENDFNFKNNSCVLSKPVVVDLEENGKYQILFNTSEGKLVSVDDEAKINWTYNTDQKNNHLDLQFANTLVSQSKSSPNIEDINFDGEKEIIFGTEEGMIFCLNKKGELLWKFDAKSAIKGSPTFVDLVGDKKKEVVFGTIGGKIFILTSEGKEIHSFKIPAGIENSPLIVGSKIILSMINGEVGAYDLKGNKFWSYKTNGKIIADMELIKIHSKPHLLIGSEDHTLYCLTMDGELKWSYKTNGPLISKVAVGDVNKDGKDEIVFGSCDNTIYCLTLDGEKLWSYETDFWVGSTPLLKDITNNGRVEIIVGSYDHNLYVLDGEGTHMLNYIPGLSGLTHQNEGYSGLSYSKTKIGKELWKFETDDIIVGCISFPNTNDILINTKSGKISKLKVKN
jgi:WD40 repeat protein